MFKSLSDNLNMLMAKARINSNELARLTGLPATTIKRIRTNEQSNPTLSTLLPIAKYFSLSISDLLDAHPSRIDDSKLDSRNKIGLQSIPILSWRECIHFDLLDYEKIERKNYTEKPLSAKGYCLIVQDDNLDFFPEKSVLIIDPALKPESGNYVIAAKSENGIASIKKYIIETDQIYLRSLVDKSVVVPLTSEYKMLGVIVQFKVELK